MTTNVDDDSARPQQLLLLRLLDLFCCSRRLAFPGPLPLPACLPPPLTSALTPMTSRKVELQQRCGYSGDDERRIRADGNPPDPCRLPSVLLSLR